MSWHWSLICLFVHIGLSEFPTLARDNHLTPETGSPEFGMNQDGIFNEF